MSADISQFHQIFFEEAAEHLAVMEKLLLELDPANPTPEHLNAIFRAAHSIKGGAATFGFIDMAEFTHVLESILDRVRNGDLPPSTALVDVALAAGDVLQHQLAGHRDQAATDPAEAEVVVARLKALSAAVQSPIAASADMVSLTDGGLQGQRYRLGLPATESISDEQLHSLEAELAALGKLEIVPSGELRWSAVLVGDFEEETIRDVFAWLVDPACVEIDTDAAVVPPSAESDEGFGFFSSLPATPTPEDDGFGFFDPPAQPVEPPAEAEDPGYGFFAPLPAPVTPTPAPAAAGISKQPKPAGETSIRVGVEKVDQLINLVGELVITHAMLAQSVADADPVLFQSLHNGIGQLERNTRDLQEAVMSIRMLPMSHVFSRFPRVVRDLADKLGKKVELKTTGEATELDKGMIEQIVDPLTHLIRNSLDHGLELPAQRAAAGKAPTGTIRLSAAHQGGHIVIEVEDDGHGLEREKILAKARERGLPIDENPSDMEVWQLIFAPGFSTAEQVTDVSGRGVGMDVVKKNIEAIGGRVELTSAAGFGTRTTIHLPLTLAILDGMSVEVGKEMFIIPLTSIVESLQPAPEQVRTISGRGSVVEVRGEFLPLVPLHQRFNLVPRHLAPEHGIVIIVGAGVDKVALFVDGLRAQHQVVIKSLETNYRKVRGISGTTIMGDGRVALILDVPALIRMA